MHPILIGTLAAGALCASALVVALIRRAVQVHRRRLAPTVTYDLEQQRWVQARPRRLSLTRRNSVGKSS